MSCAGCNEVFSLYDQIEDANNSNDDENQISEERSRLNDFRKTTVLYMAHVFRCTVQQHKINQIITSLSENHCHVLVDFKMKLEELRFRETTEQHFGKRGMSYHGAAI